MALQRYFTNRKSHSPSVASPVEKLTVNKVAEQLAVALLQASLEKTGYLDPFSPLVGVLLKLEWPFTLMGFVLRKGQNNPVDSSGSFGSFQYHQPWGTSCTSTLEWILETPHWSRSYWPISTKRWWCRNTALGICAKGSQEFCFTLHAI